MGSFERYKVKIERLRERVSQMFNIPNAGASDISSGSMRTGKGHSTAWKQNVNNIKQNIMMKKNSSNKSEILKLPVREPIHSVKST